MMETAEDLVQCSICKGLFSDPRMLPCIHNFCLRCLQESASQVNKGPGDNLACHCCGKEFTVPPGGIAGLQRSVFIADLVEEMTAAKKRGTKCDARFVTGGTKEDCVAPATMYCSECRLKLCKTCSERHRKQKVSKKHHITMMVFDPVLSSSDIDCCPLHNHQQLNLYCFECKTIVCDGCCKQSHGAHTCEPINELIENSKKQITTDLETLALHSKAGSAKKDQLEMIKTDCLRGFVDVEAQVIERGRKLKELVDAHVGCLLSELVLTKTKRMYEIDSYIEEIRTCLGLTESFERSCNDTLLKTSTLEICNEAAVLIVNAVKIQKLYESSHLKDVYSAAVTLDTSQIEERLLQMKNIVGEIREELKSVAKDTTSLTTYPVTRYCDTPTTNFASAMPPIALVHDETTSTVIEADLKPPKIQTAFEPSGIRLSEKLGIDANVCGITKLFGCIYVLARNPNAIHVFPDQKPFHLKTQIQILDIKRPHDISASEKQNCLYVMDSETKCVWQVSSDSTMRKWLSDIGNPFTLFITPDSRLIMTRQGTPSKIEIYKEDSSLDCLVPLPINIEDPLHAVENSEQNVVVSHKWRETGARETVWSISMVNNCGEILHRLCAKENLQCLKEPQHLSVDSTDQVLVADFGNGRVVLLNSDLSWNRSIETEDKDAIMFPKKLYLDSEARQLLVGQYLKKGVHVYIF